jgi:hypothetical protein
LDQSVDADALCQGLLDAQRSIAQALAQVFQAQDPVRQSYFGTTSYSICVHRLDESHAVATIFGPEVREGQVWYAMREGLDALQTALQASEQAPPPSRSPARNHGVDMVERYFQQQQEASQARPRHSVRDRAPQPPQVQTRARAETPIPSIPSGRDTAAAPEESPAPAPLPPPLKMERLQIDRIDWELGESQDWDTLAADTDQSFRGMSYEEAQKRGLLDELNADD